MTVRGVVNPVALGRGGVCDVQAELLLRVRRARGACALARLDEQAFLRRVRAAVLRKRFGVPLLLCATLACACFLLGRATRTHAPAAVFERNALDLTRLPAPYSARARNASRDAASNSNPTKPEPAYGPDGTSNERPTDPSEVVYICGARTKKGTPCSRRVRGPGRCWQHRGMPAILPPSKLVVPG
jgi:hypothetical protein